MRQGRFMRIRLSFTAIVPVVAALLLPVAAKAAERYAYESFPAPGSEAEETGNLFVLSEGQEPAPLELWGRNPSVDTRGRLIAYEQDGTIYVTDYRGKTVREFAYAGREESSYPQWVPGHGLV